MNGAALLGAAAACGGVTENTPELFVVLITSPVGAEGGAVAPRIGTLPTTTTAPEIGVCGEALAPYVPCGIETTVPLSAPTAADGDADGMTDGAADGASVGEADDLGVAPVDPVEDKPPVGDGLDPPPPPPHAVHVMIRSDAQKPPRENTQRSIFTRSPSR